MAGNAFPQRLFFYALVMRTVHTEIQRAEEFR